MGIQRPEIDFPLANRRYLQDAEPVEFRFGTRPKFMLNFAISFHQEGRLGNGADHRGLSREAGWPRGRG
jgi:hypothetical protein